MLLDQPAKNAILSEKKKNPHSSVRKGLSVTGGEVNSKEQSVPGIH